MIYNPKTGEFEDGSEVKQTAPQKPRYTPSPANNSQENNSGCISTIFGIVSFVLLNSIPYFIIAGLVSLCS